MLKNKNFGMVAAGEIFTDKRKTADKPRIRGENH